MSRISCWQLQLGILHAMISDVIRLLSLPPSLSLSLPLSLPLSPRLSLSLSFFLFSFLVQYLRNRLLASWKGISFPTSPNQTKNNCLSSLKSNQLPISAKSSCKW